MDFFKDYAGIISVFVGLFGTLLTALVAYYVKVQERDRKTLIEELKKLEGRIDEQQKTIFESSRVIAIVTTKLEAVFRYIDAPRRATDKKL